MTMASGIFYSYFVVLSGDPRGSLVGLLLPDDLVTDFCNDLTYPRCILLLMSKFPSC